MIDTLNLTARN